MADSRRPCVLIARQLINPTPTICLTYHDAYMLLVITYKSFERCGFLPLQSDSDTHLNALRGGDDVALLAVDRLAQDSRLAIEAQQVQKPYQTLVAHSNVSQR